MHDVERHVSVKERSAVTDFPLNRLVEYLCIRLSAEMLRAPVSLCP